MHKLIIIGAGGHGKEVAWSIGVLNARSPFAEVLGYCDDTLARDTQVLGFPVLGTIEAVAASHGESLAYVCAVGKNEARPSLVARAEAAGWSARSVVHPTAVVSPESEIGPGTFIAPGAYVGPHARLGSHCVLNCHVSIGHDAVLGDHVQACPGVRVSGSVRLGTGVFLGSNAVVSPGVSIGEWSKLSACSWAAADVPDNTLAWGVPARKGVSNQA